MALIEVKVLKELLQRFPEFRCAFAYGSGVFTQSFKNGTIEKGKMLDFILVVNNSVDWHHENLIRNYKDYSALKYLGPEIIANVQTKGAQCYFNTLINVNDYYIKYGVINHEHLINDLLDWNHLYIAGRLHKPLQMFEIKNYRDKKDILIANAIKINRQSAVHAALLLLDETFSLNELFLVITGLSYDGDFRMVIGEDKQKKNKIVDGQYDLFIEMYEPYLKELCEKNILYYNEACNKYVQEHNPSCVFHHLNLLPKRVQQRLYVQANRSGKLFDIDDVLLSLAHSYQCADFVRKAIADIVFRSSLLQSAKGILTAGGIKSARYAFLKFQKMYKSMKK